MTNNEAKSHDGELAVVTITAPATTGQRGVKTRIETTTHKGEVRVFGNGLTVYGSDGRMIVATMNGYVDSIEPAK